MADSGSQLQGAPCCSPSRGSGATTTRASAARATGSLESIEGMAALAGGTFRMGSDDRFAYRDDGEDPREVAVGPFAIDMCAVSNARFAQFVDASGYVTEAEGFGWSFV